MRKLIKVAFLLLSCLLLLSGCRTPLDVEANLRPEVFAIPGASITKDQGGRLYGVAANQGQILPFATIESQGETHLFATIPRGERAAQLLGLTRFEMAWFNEAMDGQGALQFHEDLSDLVVSDSVALWQGGAANSGSPRWLGPVPEGAYRAVAIPVATPIDANAIPNIAGTLAITSSAVDEIHQNLPTHEGPYLLLLDGVRSDFTPRAAFLGTQALPTMADRGWTWVQSGAAPVGNAAEAAQIASNLGVDLITAQRDGEFYIGFSTDSTVPSRGPFRVRPMVADRGIWLPVDASARDQQALMEGIDALLKGHFLSSFYHFTHLPDDSPGRSTVSRRARQGDLAAAAGLESWGRHFFLRDQSGFDPESAFLLARAFLYQGDSHGATVNLRRARELNGNTASPGRELRLAKYLEWEAKLSTRLPDARPDRIFDQAANLFEEAGDLYRAGLARREAALYRPRAQEFEEIAALLARAGATYESKRTLLWGVYSLIETGQTQEAVELLEAFHEAKSADAERLQLLAEPLGRRVAAQQSFFQSRQELNDLLERALSIHAWEAAALASMLRQRFYPVHDLAEITRVTSALNEAQARAPNSGLRPEITRILGSLCLDLGADAADKTDSSMPIACRNRLAELASQAEGIRTIIAGGFRFLQRANLQGARDVEELLYAAIPNKPEFDALWADFLFFRAALHEEWRRAPDYDIEEELVVSSIQQGFELLRQTLPLRDAPAYLIGLGHQYQDRGYARLSAGFFRAARQASRNANDPSTEFDAALRQALALYHSQSWRELADIEAVDSPLHSVRIKLYQAHAHRMRENLGTARELEREARAMMTEFGGLQRISIEHVLAELALNRGNLAEAKEALQRANGLYQELSPENLERRESKVLHSRTLIRNAKVLLLEDNYGEARERATQANALLEGIAPQEAVSVFVEVQRTLAELENTQDAYTQRLDALRALISTEADLTGEQRRDVLTTAMDLSFELPEANEVLPLVQPMIQAGLGLGASRAEHHCCIGKAELFGGSTTKARNHFRFCARSGDSRLQAEVSLYLAMLDENASPEFRAGMAELLASESEGRPIAPGEIRRLHWIHSYVQSREGATEARRRQEESRFEEFVGTPQERLEATVNYVEYLLGAGYFSHAAEILQSRSQVFYDRRLNGEFQWVRLRVTSLLRQLRPFDVLVFAARAFGESEISTNSEEAEALYLQAIAYLQAGQYFAARDYLDRAMILAGGTSGIWSDIEALDSTLGSIRP